MFLTTNILPDLQPHHIADIDLWRRAKHLPQCKDSMWTIWSNEYLRSLREKHNLKHSGKSCTLTVGDVVIIKSKEKNRGKWPLGIVMEPYPGRDGVVRAVKVHSRRNSLDRWVKHLYPLELSSESVVGTPSRVLNRKWYMKCFIYWTADLKSSKLWSSQLWTQFKQLRIEARKSQDFNGVWTRDLAIPVRCSNQLRYEATEFLMLRHQCSNGGDRLPCRLKEGFVKLQKWNKCWLDIKNFDNLDWHWIVRSIST